MATSGPYEDIIYLTGFRKRKVWYRQTPPFVAPLFYQNSWIQGWQTDSVSGNVRVPAMRSDSPSFQKVDQRIDAHRTDTPSYQRAYDSLVRNMRAVDGGASMGVTVAESRSAWTMISDRFNRLVRLGDLLKHGGSDINRSIVEAVGLLLLNERNANRLRKAWPSRKAVARDFASSYLELIFGWGPLLKDIQDAINVLQTPRIRSKEWGSGAELLDQVSSSKPPWLPPGGWMLYSEHTKVTRRLHASVTITNPNLDLANRLGFVNLPAIAYELIPGSFLFDWFVPVGRFLDSWTDFLGREISGVYMSVKVESRSKRDENYAGAGGRGFELYEDTGRGFYRFPMATLPSPNWFRGFRLPTRDLQGRAITLFALFTQSFSK